MPLTQDFVKEINTDLKDQHDDAVRHRENPRIISMLKTLIKFTNSQEDNAAMEANKAAEPVPPTDAEILAAFRAGKIKLS